MKPFTLAVFASGGGSNFQVILDRIRSGNLPARMGFALSNNSRSPALEKARNADVTALHVSAKTEGSEDAVAERMIRELRQHQVDLVVLAGYMKKVPPSVLEFMHNRVINIHPALLPAFGGEGHWGHHVHEAVVKRGCQVTGLTIHMVNEEYDDGQIVYQCALRVEPSQTADQVAAAVLEQEHSCYWRVLRAFAMGQITSTQSRDPGHAVIFSAAFFASMAD